MGGVWGPRGSASLVPSLPLLFTVSRMLPCLQVLCPGPLPVALCPRTLSWVAPASLSLTSSHGRPFLS